MSRLEELGGVEISKAVAKDCSLEARLHICALIERVEELERELAIAKKDADDFVRECAQRDIRIAALEEEIVAIKTTVVYRLAGKVEGHPTSQINYLQRIDELREVEANLQSYRELAEMVIRQRTHGMITNAEIESKAREVLKMLEGNREKS